MERRSRRRATSTCAQRDDRLTCLLCRTDRGKKEQRLFESWVSRGSDTAQILAFDVRVGCVSPLLGCQRRPCSLFFFRLRGGKTGSGWWGKGKGRAGLCNRPHANTNTEQGYQRGCGEQGTGKGHHAVRGRGSVGSPQWARLRRAAVLHSRRLILSLSLCVGLSQRTHAASQPPSAAMSKTTERFSLFGDERKERTEAEEAYGQCAMQGSAVPRGTRD
jgi:hypothetical protein